jgi:hypothetical protein
MKLGDLTAYWPVVLLCGLVLLIFAGVYFWIKKRPNPVELERRRRVWINSIGKIADGTVLEVQPPLISYSYFVRGIEYFAGQDVSALESRLPSDQWVVIGPASVKYDPHNPANSIIITEQWTGLRKGSNHA